MSRKIYVVSAGSDYYPREGYGDWLRVFGDRGDAVAFAEGIEKARIVSRRSGLEALPCGWVSVIEVDVEDLTFNGSTVYW